jgi:exopolysaccharide biosynthesis polyprenyl glycosylphosphotransferase
MKNSASLIYNFFLIVGDCIALLAAFSGAYILRVSVNHQQVANQVHARTYILVFLALLPFWIVIFALLGLYDSNIYEKRFSEISRLFVGSFIGMLFVIFWNYLSVKPILPSKLVPIYGFLLSFLFLMLARTLCRVVREIMFRFNRGLTNIVIIGSTNVTTELIDSLKDSRKSGYRILGIVSNLKVAEQFSGLKYFESFDEAIKSINSKRISSIIQTELYKNEDKNREILEFAQTKHIGYRFIPGNDELFVGNINVELFRSSIPVIAVHQTALLGWGRIVKRLFDLVFGLILLVIALPIMLVIAVIIKTTSKGPIFFKQIRLTRYNQKFKVYKFRTLNQKYSGLSPEQAFTKMGHPEYIERYRNGGDKIDNDPRITTFGRFLRRTSLDELPQLINVVRGDLSLVGPRALVPEELNIYYKKHTILSVKSGLTGLAQVSGRRNIDFNERRKLDIYYVQNWSFWLDIVILFKTIRSVVYGGGD